MICNFYAYSWWMLPKLEASMVIGALIFGVGWVILCAINSDETDKTVKETRSILARKFIFTAIVCSLIFIFLPDNELIRAYLKINECRIR